MNTNKWPHTILGMRETISYIHDGNCSIGRFGDGEIKLMNGIDINFQNASLRLKQALIEVSNYNSKDFLVCVPLVISDKTPYTFKANLWWFFHLLKYGYLWKKFFKNQSILGDSQVTRPWMSTQDPELAFSCFTKLRNEWDKKYVIIIEGDKSRIGVGNDYLNNANSVRRILGPAMNAFSFIDEIFDAAISIAGSNKDVLFLLALGPTATILSYKLHLSGFRALDIGHVDVEYEWWKQRSATKVPLDNKYVNEAGGLGAFHESNIPDSYHKEIVWSYDFYKRY